MFRYITCFKEKNHIGDVIVIVVALCEVDRGFEFQSGQTIDYTIGICCFSAKRAALRSKNKGWFARNQNNVSEWSDMSTHGLLFQWARPVQNLTKRVGLVQSEHHYHLIDVTCSRHDIAEILLNKRPYQL